MPMGQSVYKVSFPAIIFRGSGTLYERLHDVEMKILKTCWVFNDDKNYCSGAGNRTRAAWVKTRNPNN